MEQKIHFPEPYFSKSFRGYDISDVDDYLSQVDIFVEQNQQLQKQLTDKISTLELEVSRLREVENSLFRALKMAEEAQQSWLNKMDTEVNQLIETAKEEAFKIIDEAQKEANKAKVLSDNDCKLILDQANKKSIETNRNLGVMQAAQKEVAQQLIQISLLTLEKVKTWDLNQQDASENIIGEVSPESIEVALPEEKQKMVLVKKSDELTKHPLKKGKKSVGNPKVRSQSTENAKKETQKKSLVPKQEVIEDDSLPTLNKVLEAYAKFNGPKGKVGDLN